MGSGWRFAMVFRVGFVLALVIMTSLSVIPLPGPTITSDKFNHSVAYFALAFLADFAFPPAAFLLAKALPLFAYGALVEVIQQGIPGRYAEWWDIAANGGGLLLYWLSIPLWKRVPLLRDRWASSSPRGSGGS
jgi:VanZ family protein